LRVALRSLDASTSVDEQDTGHAERCQGSLYGLCNDIS